tara:strand:+ start:549 stop:1532 length:984 start_codon:yes stop_codon:yes gene_type:complete
MKIKQTEDLVEGWRRYSNPLPPISKHFHDEELKEGWKNNLRTLGFIAPMAMGTGLAANAILDKSDSNRQTNKQTQELSAEEQYELEQKEKSYEQMWGKTAKDSSKFTDPSSEYFAMFTKGEHKGEIDKVKVMKKAAEKYADGTEYTANGNYLYINPGALDLDEPLPMTGMTAGEYRDYLFSNKDLVEIMRITMNNANSWKYGESVTQPFAYILEDGKPTPILPLDWSVALDAATAKGEAFVQEIVNKAYVETEAGQKELSSWKLEEIKKDYGIHNQGDYEKVMSTLGEFWGYDVQDRIEKEAGVTNGQGKLRENTKRRKIWIKKYNT